jgi:hypothetical protein
VSCRIALTEPAQWVSFYPGALPRPDWVIPFVHYSLAADLSIEPTDIQLRRVVYEDIPQAPSETLDCIQHNHWSWSSDHFHQATPLYRLTLCPRGCIPDEHNTLFTLGQMEARPTYGK